MSMEDPRLQPKIEEKLKDKTFVLKTLNLVFSNMNNALLSKNVVKGNLRLMVKAYRLVILHKKELSERQYTIARGILKDNIDILASLFKEKNLVHEIIKD
ncbi:hypothetical protein D3C81_09700 [compost metagenome]